ncbi:MAG: shikimate dehydrogenase [Bacteroidales bacterium]|jgi:shikimate dehydrogenase|nr:shikimate dehydrogenase [Bacteroidales bacterium]
MIRRRFGLIGFPLGHSFSKKYFEDKFISENITDTEFLNFEMQRLDNLFLLIDENPLLHGFTVTIPHKSSILPFMNTLSDEVREIGSLNVVKIQRTDKTIELHGFNTDVFGFEKSLCEHWQPHHHSALILGTGGSAKAVAYVLRKMKITYSFVSRTPFGEHAIAYHHLNKEIIKSNPLIINTTPLGMSPDTDSCPDIPYNFLTDKHFLFDLVYNPTQTLFLQKGLQQGTLACNGYDMLRYQADQAWKIWNENR